MTSREELIEKARVAFTEAWDEENRKVWAPPLDYHRRSRAGIVAALAVFEEAHTPKVIERHNFVMPDPDTPTDGEREALARLIDPEAWRDVQPHSTAFYDDEEAQKWYEGFFWDAVQERRAPSLAAADRVLGFRRSEVPEPSAEHGPDWSDWGIDHPEEGPSCKCGFNGSPEECAASREPQGEPSDTAVKAAVIALDGQITFDLMRAALRAAAEAERGENRG